MIFFENNPHTDAGSAKDAGIYKIFYLSPQFSVYSVVFLLFVV